MTWRMQRKLHRPRRVRIPQGKSRSHSGSGCFLITRRHDGLRPRAGNDTGAPRMELQVRSLLRRHLPRWGTGGKFPVLPVARLAAANAGRNYSAHHGMVWQVRLLLGIRSLARAGPSGFVHPRRRCMVCTSPAPQGGMTRQMPAGLQVEQPAEFPVWCVGCSNHPVSPKGMRSSGKTVLPPLLLGLE